MRTLVLAEFDEGSISDVTLRVVNAALQLEQPVDLLVFDASLAAAAAQTSGVDRVLIASAGAADSGAYKFLVHGYLLRAR